MASEPIIRSIQEQPASSISLNSPDRATTMKTGKKVTLSIVGVFLALVFGFIGSFLYDSYARNFLISKGVVDVEEDGVIVREVQPVSVVENDAVVDAVEKVNPAVVSIISHSKETNFLNEELESSGSGFIVTSDGLIATNKHVIDGATDVKVVTQDGRSFDATIVGEDPLSDFAMVRVDQKDLPTVELGYSDQVKVGERVIAIGNALGSYDNTVTTGVISGLNRSIVAGSEQSRLEGLLQVDAAINQGNSGGPLTNLSGQVIGINTAVDRSGEAIGFAIPINDIRPAIESVINSGKIVRPLLGVRYINITPEFASLNELKSDRGALLSGGKNGASAVVPGGPADKAGLREGDIILAINGTDLNEETSLIRALAKAKPGDEVDVKYLRDGKEATVKAKLGEAS